MDYTKIIIFCLIVIIIYLVLSNRKKKKNNKNKNTYTNITTTKNVKFSIPPNNMICSYFLDMEVFFSNSSKVNHIILDRISPIIKLNMSSGALIIEYLSSKKIDSSNKKMDEQSDLSINVDLSNNDIPVTSEDSECTCPNPGKKSNNIFSNNDNSITFPTLLRVVTPEIPFQKANHIEIRQNLRVIQIFLNGKFFYSTLLDYVPYLYKGNAIILPNESWRSINLKQIAFKAL